MPTELTSLTHESSSAIVPIDDLVSLATELGATSVAAEARRAARVPRSSRDLCSRLRFHLDEMQAALGRTESENGARINAVAISRALVEHVLEARFHQRDVDRERFATRLGVERTKFLMSCRADAMVALAEHLAAQPRHARSLAATAARDIAAQLLAGFSQRMHAESANTIELATRRLLADIESSLGDLGETLPTNAMAGLDRLPARGRRELALATAPGVLAVLADRIGLRRTELAARDELVRMLDAGSLRVIERVLADADDARSAVEHRFCELIDAALETVHVAARFAADARARGPDAIAQARLRIAAWSRELDDLRAQLERQVVGPVHGC